MIHVQIDPDYQPEIAEVIVERAARETIQHVAALDSDFTLVLTSDAYILGLNREFRGVDAPTDVLAFPTSEKDPETGRLYCGDIIISVQTARAQAIAGNHPIEEEISLLVVHGVLHLLGYDHDTPQQKNKMWTTQSAILEQLGYSPMIVHE
jgi:probable rRNA maturation factor